MPKISVITINLNNKDGLAKTIHSVVHQTFFDHVEYIVIDGGSTDGSIDIIRENERHIAHWCSEPDNGIYDAMNKGIDMASGDYCIFLNSGDTFYMPTSIQYVYPHLDADFVYGNLMIDGKNLKEYPDRLSPRYFQKDSLPHPSTFIRTDILKAKKYNSSYRIIADWIFFLECLCDEGKTYRHVDVTVSNFLLGGISSNMGKVELEKKRYKKSRV